jgi:type II secretory pathway predicted ATPase ExeA
MYEAYFKFSARPFLAAPDPARYVATALIEDGRRTLLRSIERAEGPGLIVGPAGTGKSMLCRVLAGELADRFGVALLVSGRFARRRELLQAILHELGLPYRGLEEGELRLSLLDALHPAPTRQDGLLLIVDEAHSLNFRLLEEIRMLTNLVRDGVPRVRVVLAGNNILEERFANPKLNSFSQRLAARVYLDSLDSSETTNFVRAQIAAVGGDPSRLFDNEALRCVHRASDGTPRLINQVCDHALMLAALDGARQVTARIVEESWADLQRLPSPWTQPERISRAEQVVEFGGLDEPTDERVAAIPFPASAQRLQLSNAGEGEDESDDADVMSSELDSFADRQDPTGTEVDLDFPEFGDPFSEQFQDEEVVLDRYGSDAELFDALPKVTCSESRQLAALLAAWTAPTSVLVPTTTLPRMPDTVEIAGQAPLATLHVTPTWCMADAGTLTLPEHLLPRPPRAGEQEGPTESAQAGTLRQLSLGRAAIVAPGEQPVIVVEEPAARSVAPPPPHLGGLNRKREFRQLFAKLRRE